jgi:plasmid stabilization system protein ParE
MSYEINVKETADKNLVNAVKYYESSQEGLGERFLNCWEQTLELLKQAPQSYQKKYKNFRQILIKPFPYHIIYEIEGTTIVVYNVPYARRHPRKRYKKK